MPGDQRLAGGCTLIERCALPYIPKFGKRYPPKLATHDEDVLRFTALFSGDALDWA